MGALTEREPEWLLSGATRWTLEVVRSGFRLLWAGTPPALLRHPPPFRPPASPESRLVLEQEIQTLLLKQAVELVLDLASPGYYCRLFTVPKRTGGFRPVLDLSSLNGFLAKKRFRMETPRSFRESLSPGDWVTSLDLTDAYFHVLVHPQDRKWLRFRWKDQVFQFRALPFGLSLSPWVFTKIVRDVCSLVHRLGIRMRAYLDDWAIQSQSQDLARSHTETVLRHAEALGFNVNLAKSDLIPSQDFLYLGLRFNTVSWVVKPSSDRIDRLLTSIHSLLTRSTASARELAHILGSMEAMVPIVPLAGVAKRLFQREFRARWSQTEADWDSLIPLTDWFPQATSRWLQPGFLTQGVPISLPLPAAEIFSDASHLGWGAHMSGHHVSGTWDSDVSSLHINSLELMAVFNALKELASVLPTGHIRVRSDNSTVIAYINHQGGTVSHSLSLLAEEILEWTHERGIHLSAVHVQGKANILADLLSRPGMILQTEWTLVREALTPVWETFGKPLLDLFATNYSTRLPMFVSPVPDPQAWAVDAMAIPWMGLNAYAFPPFALLSRVLQKWEREQPRLILVAPDWPAQGWYPTLLQCARAKLPLELGPLSLIQPRSGIPHGNIPMLKLTAWLLSPLP